MQKNNIAKEKLNDTKNMDKNDFLNLSEEKNDTINVNKTDILNQIEKTNGTINFNQNNMPNAVIVDPPRKGLDDKTLKNLCDLKLEKLVYVSCNPATLARDLAILQNTYEIKSITPIDNFPYSTHVETIVALQTKDSIKLWKIIKR